jgi:hypothetical protein
MVSDAGAGDSVTRVAEGARALLPALAGPQAVLRDDQLAAIQALVVHRRRAVVVKRTGWGKSAVYFLATRLAPGRRGRAHPAGLAAAVADAGPDRQGPGHRHPRRHHQLHQPGPVATGRGRAGRRPDRPAADLARAAQQPPVPHPGPARPVRQGGAAGDRRGPLHLRLVATRKSLSTSEPHIIWAANEGSQADSASPQRPCGSRSVPRPVPTLACAAGNGDVRSPGPKPKETPSHRAEPGEGKAGRMSVSEPLMRLRQYEPSNDG